MVFLYMYMYRYKLPGLPRRVVLRMFAKFLTKKSFHAEDSRYADTSTCIHFPLLDPLITFLLGFQTPLVLDNGEILTNDRQIM